MTYIQISQEASGLEFPSPEEFTTVCCDPVKGFGIFNKAGVDVFLEFSCFFDDATDVGNFTSGSSVSSRFSLKIYILLKPGLENFEHYFASV